MDLRQGVSDNQMKLVDDMPIMETKITFDSITVIVDINCRFTVNEPLLFVFVSTPKLYVTHQFQVI